MKKPYLALAPAAVAVALAGCGGGGGGYSKAAPSPGASALPTVVLGHSKFGNILVDGRGRTLYLFEADRSTTSTCYS
jgi:predicted lipoprotein with Yx(FWY)xxD motif